MRAADRVKNMEGGAEAAAMQTGWGRTGKEHDFRVRSTH